MIRGSVLARPTLKGLLLVLVAGCGVAPAVAEGPELERARHAFLVDRDASALAGALASIPPTTADEATDRMMATLAVTGRAAAAAGSARGYAALPEILAHLRGLDLASAEAATARLGRASLPGGIDAWIRALVDVRRGRDERARGRLLAWSPANEPPERGAFRVALVGAVLPETDRVLLAGVGREALLGAARDGQFDAVARLAEVLVALDGTVGADALCLALRALRRSGRSAEADRLLTRPAASAVDGDSCFRLERGLHLAWRGQVASLPSLLRGLEVPGRLAPVIEALGRTQGFRTQPTPGAVEIPFEERHAHALAALATRLGRPTPPSEVEAAAVAQRARTSDSAFAVRFLTDRGFAVLSVAGGVETALRAADAGVPFLFRAIQLEGDAFREEPVLVLGRDPASGLWLTSPGDIERLDVMPADAPGKARLLVALPQARAAELATWPVAGEREAGAALDRAVRAADAGQLDEALRVLAARDQRTGDPAAVLALYRAYFEHARHEQLIAGGETDAAAAALMAVGEALRRSMRASPTLVFEYIASYQSLYATGRRDAGVESLEAAENAAPASAFVPLTLFAVYQREGRRPAALGAVDRALRAAPLDTSLLYYRGRTRRALGLVEEARGDLRRALDRRPDWVPVGLELAHLELGRRQPEAALAVLADLRGRVPSLAQDEAATLLRREAEHRLVQAVQTQDGLEPLLASEDRETRRRAAYRLADFETDGCERRLRTLLADADPAVRVTVLRMYMRPWLRTRAEDDDVLAARLIGVLRDDPSPLARGAAVGLLSLVRRPEILDALLSALVGAKADASASVRAEVASVLARRDDPRVRAALVEALADPDPGVRRAAIDALLQIAGTYRGFDPDGAPDERAEAIEAWRAWLRA